MLHGLATFEEIKRSWSLKDLMDAHEVLDLMAEQRKQALKEPPQES